MREVRPPGDSRTGTGSAQAPGLSKAESRERHTHWGAGTSLPQQNAVPAEYQRQQGSDSVQEPGQHLQTRLGQQHQAGPVERVNLGTRSTPEHRQVVGIREGSLQAGLRRGHQSQAGGVANTSFCRRGSVRRQGGAARKDSGTEHQPARAGEHPL